MSFQIANILKGCGGVQLNHIAMHSSKKMTTITEGTLKKKLSQTSITQFNSSGSKVKRLLEKIHSTREELCLELLIEITSEGKWSVHRKTRYNKFFHLLNGSLDSTRNKLWYECLRNYFMICIGHAGVSTL